MHFAFLPSIIVLCYIGPLIFRDKKTAMTTPKDPTIDIATVKKVDDWARLAVNDDEALRYQQDLNRILKVIAQMQAINTTNVEPMDSPLNMHQRFRDDVVTEKNQRELMQSGAPQTQAGLYLVPKVIE